MNNGKWYESSSPNGGLSMTIGGFSVIGIAQALSLILGRLGVNTDTNVLAGIIVGVITGIGSLITAYGILRKVYYRIRGATA